MVIVPKKVFRFLRIGFWSAVLLSAFIVLTENPFKHLVTRFLFNYVIVDIDWILNLMLYVFLTCSTTLLVIVYWLASDFRRIKAIYKHYVSRLVAKDYYKDSKSLNLKGIIDGLSRYPAQKMEAEEKEDQVEEKISALAKVYKKEQEIAKEVRYEDDQGVTIQKSYYQNGNVAKEIPFKDGKIHGALRTYYSDGTLHQEKEYREGRLNGTYRAHDENGMLYFEINYKDDKQHGLDKIFYKNGAPQYVDTYVEGERVNRKTYDESGDLKFDQDF